MLRNDVMLRINDVALRAKGKLHFPNTKVLDFLRAFRVFRGKNTSLSPLHLSLNLMDLNLRLYENVLKKKNFYDIINDIINQGRWWIKQ